MTPGSDPNDLSRKLAQRKADEAHRRQRAIQQFSHRFRLSGLIMSFFFLLLSFIFYTLNMRLGRPFFAYLTIAAIALGWLYLLLLPILFSLRTTLRAYVLEKHWMWLALVAGLPIDIYLLPASGRAKATGAIGRMPIVFFALLLVGFLWRRARREAFWEEVRKREDVWARLLSLGVLDIALFGFWHIRPSRQPPALGE